MEEGRLAEGGGDDGGAVAVRQAPEADEEDDLGQPCERDDVPSLSSRLGITYQEPDYRRLHRAGVAWKCRCVQVCGQEADEEGPPSGLSP